MGRFAIITIQPAENVSNDELIAELKKRLESKSFSVDRITILDEQTSPTAVEEDKPTQ